MHSHDHSSGFDFGSSSSHHQPSYDTNTYSSNHHSSHTDTNTYSNYHHHTTHPTTTTDSSYNHHKTHTNPTCEPAKQHHHHHHHKSNQNDLTGIETALLVGSLNANNTPMTTRYISQKLNPKKNLINIHLPSKKKQDDSRLEHQTLVNMAVILDADELLRKIYELKDVPNLVAPLNTENANLIDIIFEKASVSKANKVAMFEKLMNFSGYQYVFLQEPRFTQLLNDSIYHNVLVQLLKTCAYSNAKDSDCLAAYLKTLTSDEDRLSFTRQCGPYIIGSLGIHTHEELVKCMQTPNAVYQLLLMVPARVRNFTTSHSSEPIQDITEKRILELKNANPSQRVELNKNTRNFIQQRNGFSLWKCARLNDQDRIEVLSNRLRN